MSKKKNNNKAIHIDAMEVWNAKKPRYNPYQGGNGVHKSAKDYRRKPKHRYSEGE